MVGIKDLEMPSCCNSCGHWSFNRDDEPLCDLTYKYIRQFDKRQDDCPLIEIKEHEDDNWISVKEQLPKPNEINDHVRKYYLVQNEYDDMLVAYWDGAEWHQMYQGGYVEDKVVAWMELPKEYKENEDEA